MTATEHMAQTLTYFLDGQHDKAYHWYAAVDPYVVSPIMTQDAFTASLTKLVVRRIISESVGHVANTDRER